MWLKKKEELRIELVKETYANGFSLSSKACSMKIIATYANRE
jgi:hypothetical protein